ncbi:helix-turn-helix domain-containing protein [Chitinilyticum litopenaei]|uniref:helix-turn-helix domain-containing protein n=1 Tax=Chitinilyticum litopenaei TaxID=1121276 RepID=UPI0011867A9A|nr:helix-turn-helix domain-containing protein [Chitinilyticum litopenaei]
MLIRFHFERVFGDAVGRTPMDYLRLRRLQRAALRVRYEARTSLLQLAQECGFASNASFSRSFRQYFGFSPSDWRHGAWHDYMQDNQKHIDARLASQQSPDALAFYDFWRDVMARRSFVGDRITLRRMPAAHMWFVRQFGLWGFDSYASSVRLAESYQRAGLIGENPTWCSLWPEDNGITRPDDLIGDIGLLADGPPPQGLLARSIPGGLYAVLETVNEPFLTQWLHEDWLDRQTTWTADMTRPYVYHWRDTPHGEWLRAMLPVRPA